MSIGRSIAGMSILALAGCASSLRATYPTADACIHDQFFSAVVGTEPAGLSAQAQFAKALTVCGDPVPDLTGDTMAQAVAIRYGFKFKVNLAKDTAMKKSIGGEIIGTGSLIPVTPMVFKPS
jgi:hypothetical protein